jgi:ribosomal protein S21
MTPMVNVEVEKTGSESGGNLLRRFTKRVQGSGILNKRRASRYMSRALSKYVKKKKTLKSLNRRAEINLLRKLGKLPEKSR